MAEGQLITPPRCKECKQLMGYDVKYYETVVTVNYQGRKSVASREFYHYGACPKPDAAPRRGRFNNLDMT